MKMRFGLLAVIFLSLITGKAAFAAQIEGFGYDGTIHQARSDTYTIGNLFTVGATDLSVIALGAQDFSTAGAATDGLANDVQVGLWNSSGTTLLASTTVLKQDPIMGTATYRYHTLSSAVTLTAKTQYLIGALVGTTSGEYWGDAYEANGSTATAYFGNGIATIDSAQVASTNTLSAPINNGGGLPGRWAPANFLTDTPEPASIGLLSLGGAVLLARRRRSA